LEKEKARKGLAIYGEQSNNDTVLQSFLQKGQIPTETKDLSVTNDGQGVTVRGQWSDRIFEKIIETSPVRAAANVTTTDSNELEVLVDREEPGSSWIGELAAHDETTTSFLTRQKIAVHEHYAYPQVTLQMLDDSQFNVENWLQGKLLARFSRQEAGAFINGDGVGKPKGLLDYGVTAEALFTWGADPAAYTIGAQYSGVAGDITNADVLFDLVDSVKSAYLPGAGWMLTRAMRNKVRKLKDQENRYLFEPSLQTGTPDRLLGYPVFLAEDMPALAADVVGALFGNFREAYTIVDRLGITVQRDTVTKPGWVKYYARRRVGGALTNPEAVKALVLGLAA
jgi:HK97 family phage major capsid protein